MEKTSFRTARKGKCPANPRKHRAAEDDQAAPSKQQEGKHIPLQLLIYLRNADNAAALNANYIASSICLTRAQKKKACELMRKKFEEYLQDSGISNEPGNPRKPMQRFLSMPKPVCEYIRPTLQKMLEEDNYEKYFKKTDFDLVDSEEKCDIIKKCIEKILKNLGKKAPEGNHRKRKQRRKLSAQYEEAVPRRRKKIDEVSSGPQNGTLEIQKFYIEIVKPQPNCGVGTETVPSDVVPIMQSAFPDISNSNEEDVSRYLSRNYCGVCGKKITRKSLHISLSCIHRICCKCANLHLMWNAYTFCKFCKRHVMYSRVRFPTWTSVTVPEEAVISYIQIDGTIHKNIDNDEKFDASLKIGERLAFMGITESFFRKVKMPIVQEKARSIEMYKTDATTVFGHIIIEPRNVKEIVMLSCENVPASILNIAECCLHSLSHLNLTRCSINDETLNTILSYAKAFPHMKKLILDENILTAISGSVIADFFKNRKEIRILCLNGNSLAEGHIPILKAVKGSGLKRLELRNCGITGFDETITEVLQCTKIEELCLADNPICERQSAINIAEGLKSNTSLKILWIRRTHLGEDGAKAIASAMVTNTGLRELGMGQNYIKEEGAFKLAEALRTNKTLVALYLIGNQLTTENVKKFSDVLKVNSTLKLLGLESVDLFPSCKEAVCELLHSAKGLKYLFLNQGSFHSIPNSELRNKYANELCGTNKGPRVQFMC